MGGIYAICDRYLLIAKSRPPRIAYCGTCARASLLRTRRKRELELALLPGAGCVVIGRRQARDRRWTTMTLAGERLLDVVVDAVAQRRLYVDVGGGASFQHARPGFLMDR